MKNTREPNCADLLARCDTGKEMRDHMETLNFGIWQSGGFDGEQHAAL